MTFFFWFSLSFIPHVYTVLDHLFGARLGALEKHYVLLQLMCLRWATTRRCVCLCTTVLSFQPFAYSVAPLCPMTGWACQWKPFWIPVEDSFKKAYLEEWVFINNASSERSNSVSQGDVIPETPEVSMPVSSSPWEPAKTQDKACFWERIEAPLPPTQPRCTCERLESSDAILSGYEDLVSSGSDHFTMWRKMSPHEILAEHVVDIHKVVVEYRDAFERNLSSSSQSATWKGRRISETNCGKMTYCHPARSI